MDTRVDWAEISAETLDDRRQGKRVKLRYEIEVSFAGVNGKPVSVRAFTRDVSHHGCSFEINRSVMLEDILMVKVFRRDHAGRMESTLPLPFRVVWVKREKDLWIAGAEMVEPERPWGISFPSKSPPAKSSFD